MSTGMQLSLLTRKLAKGQSRIISHTGVSSPYTCIQLTTSGNSIETSLPTVIAAMTFLTASFLFDLSELCSSDLNSRISPAGQNVAWSYAIPRSNCALSKPNTEHSDLFWWRQSIFRPTSWASRGWRSAARDLRLSMHRRSEFSRASRALARGPWA